MPLGNSGLSTRHSWKLYIRLLNYLRPHKIAFFIGILGYLLFALTSVAAAQWLGWTVDAIENGDNDWRILSPLLCVFIALVRGTGGFMGGYSISYIANHLIYTLRGELMARILCLPIKFFDSQQPGKLVSKITYDVNQITGAVTTAVTVILREGLTVVSLLAALFVVDWQLSLTFLAIMPVVAGIVALAAKKFRKYSTQMQDSMGSVTQIATEAIRGRGAIRIFNAVEKMAGEFETANRNNRAQNMKMAITEGVSTPIVQLIVSIAVAILVWFSMAPQYMLERSPGEFVTFLTMASLLAKPIRQLSQVNALIQRGLAAAESIFIVLDQPKEKNSGSSTVARVKGHLNFDTVSLSYGKESFALEGISLEITPGQIVAIVGKSGAGKSSLVNLIPRIYERSGGQIEIDGIPIDDFELASLREQISTVDQHVVLFSGSILENITFGDKGEIDQAKLLKSIEDAHVSEFVVQFPEGLLTQVGDDATMLSGGQRQRIAIARALYKNAPILILDEATSALDSHSEKHVKKAMQNLVRGRTTIVIAHRLSTIQNADTIVVLSSGKIAEIGNHDDLLKANGSYSELFHAQFEQRSSSTEKSPSRLK